MDLKQGDLVPESVKTWWKADFRAAEAWRKEAKQDFEFRDGHQWTDDEKRLLDEQMRPVITMNRTGVIVDAVCGAEISNRQEVRYVPREEGDQRPSEMLTSASRWFRDRADGDDNDSEAFRDCVTAGMGWTETRIDYEENPAGDMVIERIDPFEMAWDYAARKRNLLDANRIWRVRRIPIAEAEALLPGFEPEDMDADWADVWEDQSDPHVAEKTRDRAAKRRADGTAEITEVVLAHMQWIERETAWAVTAPNTGEPVMMTDEEFEQVKAATGLDDAALKARKTKRKVRYQAFLGKKVLKVGPAACPHHFSHQCITGKRDQTKGMFYGLVRVMRDPQSWANKFFSQILHIINSNAKGGILAERGAFENDQEAQESWARADRITWTKSGKLQGPNPAWAAKPQTQFPQGLQYMLELAISATRDVTGVNLEMLGMREAEQAGVLEYQRRQAGMTILQPLFDSLKTYRREQGEIILYYIQNYLADGRLIRVLGENEGQYARLVKEADYEYDLIIDDMPTSPNNKEMIWSMIGERFFDLPMEMQMVFLPYSPFPSETVEKMKAFAEKAAESPEAMLKQKMMEMEVLAKQAEAILKQAQSQLAEANAVKIAREAAVVGQEDPAAQAELSMSINAAEQDAAIKLDKHNAEKVMAAEKHALEMQRMQIELQRQQAEIEALQRGQGMEVEKHARGMSRMDLEDDLMIRKQEADIETNAIAADAKAAGSPSPKRKAGGAQTPPGPITKLAEQIAKQGEALAILAKAASAPKRLVKDSQGRAIGVETVLQ